jgi:tRNA threonylcarbamoyl adenosine modification protein YeaZ
MKRVFVLGIETATSVGGVAIADASGVRVCLRADLDRSHSRRTTSLIEEALEAVGVRAESLAAVGVSIGPGSFTGVRVGLSVAKGLCLATGAPLIAISTLEALASRADGADEADEGAIRRGGEIRPICPVLDARRGEVYAALFGKGQGEDAPLTRRHRDWCGPIDDWVDILEERLGGGEGDEAGAGICFTGDAAGFQGERSEGLRRLLSDRFGSLACFSSAADAAPGADAVAMLALRQLGESADAGRDWEALEPCYVRPHDARPPAR